MLHDPKVCLEDALNAALLIKEFTLNMSFEEYRNDLKTQSAVERQFEIIGEAFNRVFKMNEEILISVNSWKEIIGFRNVIIHGYDALSDDIVWDTIINNIPVLIKDLQTLI